MSSSLEVKVYNFLKDFRGKSFLLAISGGRDSMALLKIFESLAPKLNLQFSVGHVHHGIRGSVEQTQFRHQCYSSLKQYCSQSEIPFVSNIQNTAAAMRVPNLKNSEAELRKYRQACFQNFLKNGDFDFLVTAHHREDLFETRILRMLRGTGPQGLVAMEMKQGLVLRPFLQSSKEQLAEYLSTSPYFADPSNQSTRYLRNWLRNRWLPQLEKKRPGAVQSLQQSIELCLEALQVVPSLDFCFDEHGQVLRTEYAGLSLVEKKRVWARYLKQQDVKNYGLSHINELVKRLDVEQKDLTFRLLKKRWLANARHIWCESKNELE